jgi:GNAT superfamily N-acetyltransferase
VAEPSGLGVRLAGAGDVAGLAALRREWTEEYLGRPADDAGFDARFAGWWAREVGRRSTWLAELRGTGVGMLNVTVFDRMPRPGVPDRSWGYVGNVYVRAAHRNRGIGTALLAAVIEHSRGAGYARLVLSPSERSIPLYTRVGFRPATSLMLLPLDG